MEKQLIHKDQKYQEECEQDNKQENSNDYDYEYVREYYDYDTDGNSRDNTDDNTDDNNNEEDEKYIQGYEPQEYKPAPITIPEIDYSKMFKEICILNNIKTYITYINTDNEIESINQKKIFLNNQDNIVTRKQLIEVIKNSQRKYNTKYKLISIMVYNIHVTPETLPNYIENPNDFISLFTLNRIESFELKPTLRLLKKYNGIYFFFFECPQDELNDSSSNQNKNQNSNHKNDNVNTESNSFIRNNNTKRIHISGLHKQKKQNHKKTKRYDRYVNLL